MDLIDVKEEVAEMLRDCGGGRGVASAGVRVLSKCGVVQMQDFRNVVLSKCGIVVLLASSVILSLVELPSVLTLTLTLASCKNRNY